MANEFLPLNSERFADAFTASPIPSELSQEQKNTLLVVTHDMNIAGQFHRKITIEDGRIIG